MRLRYSAVLKVLALIGAATVCAHADSVIYYSGPDTLAFGPAGLPAIAGGYGVMDPFTIGSAGVVNKIGFSAWITPSGYPQPSSVDWAITTAPDLNSVDVKAQGASGSLNNALTASGVVQRNYINDIYWSTFAVSPVSLSPGTYWLYLSSADLTSGLGWGYASDSGAGEGFQNGIFRGIYGGTQSFGLYNVPSSVPEPGTMDLLGTLIVGLALLAWRWRRA